MTDADETERKIGMGITQQLGKAANFVLKPIGIQIVRPGRQRPWDAEFARWIAKAQAVGQDPNDIGDIAWSEDPLKEALETHYLPHINPRSIVLELGPGTGRLTRHIIARCQEIVLVDYSRMVCEWLDKYLEGKGKYRIYQISAPSLPMIENESIDVILANGVFEHIDLYDLSRFLDEFSRVMRPGGILAFNFDNITTDEGMAWFKQHRGLPGHFRFYHPETVSQLAATSGYRVLQLATGSSRLAYVELMKLDFQS